MNSTEKGYRVSDTSPNVRIYEAGATVIEEGSPDDGCIYILTNGRLGVFLKGKQFGEMAESGMMFGEMATILNTDRTATIKALTESKITIYTGGLRRIITQYPAVTMKIIVTLAERVQTLSEVKVAPPPRGDGQKS